MATGELRAGGQLALDTASSTGEHDIATLPGAPTPRYRWMIEPATAAGKLGAEEQDESRRRVLDHLLDHLYGVAERLDPGKWRPLAPRHVPVFDTELHALAWFDAEAETVIAAQLVAFDAGDLETPWRFAVAAWSPLRVRRRHDDQLGIQAVAARAADRARGRIAEVIAAPPLARQAYALTGLGLYDEAVDTATSALKSAEEIGHDWSRSTALTERGRAHRAQGNLGLALADLVAALEIDQDRVVIGPDGEPTSPATAIGLRWTEIADTQLAAGDIEAAVRSARNAVTAVTKDPRRHRETVRAVATLGHALIAAGHPQEAITELHEAADLIDLHTDPGYLGRLKELIGDAHAALGHVEPARRFHDDAVRLYEQNGQPGNAEALRTRLGHPSPTTDDDGTTDPAG
ncbi:hypothetical protein ADK67_27870 [Saccharothrix sp. NRRL B-16348]|nr:hypothetical protein ADK67_27870 [Saccharothrix sp. NRRL B-16348]